MKLKPKKKNEEKKIKVIGCNGCHRTDVTLIKCTDSYYCKYCMVRLGKKKFNKHEKEE